MKIYSISFFILMCSLSTFSQSNIAARIKCEHARFAFEAGYYDDAVKIYNECIAKYDSMPEALYGAALVYYYSGNYSNSKKLINAVFTRANPEFKSTSGYKNAFRLAALIEDTEKSPFEMVFVQGGIFTMGCKEGIDVECEDEERPSHKAEVKDFFIGKYEVTQAQWKNVMGSNPSGFTGCDNCPVESVSWDDAQAFIEKLNRTYPSLRFRLPAEAEWEFAARGGNKTQNFKYCGSNNPDDVSWYSKNADNKTHPVGSKAANELGIYDLGGNVWEWCNDWFFFYSGTNTEISRGPLAKSHHTDRGGCWQYTSKYTTPGTRGGLTSDEKSNDLGFRLARTVVVED